MKTGYDLRLRTNVTVQQYHHHYGAKLNELGKPRGRPDVICPACGETLHTVGETGALVDATWAHDPAPSTGCPIKDSGAAKYALLKPSHPVPAAAAALRASFFKNWPLHWSYARSLADYADIEGFSGFIRYADKTELWAYATLQEWQLPYTFLATCEFPPPAGKAAVLRREWLRFRFDAKLRTIEDLWIRVLPDLRFLRLRYRKPRSGDPTASHYIDCDTFIPNPGWMLAHSPAPPHAFAVRHMHAMFPAELGPCPV